MVRIQTLVKFLLIAPIILNPCQIDAQEETFVMSQLGSNNMLNRPWDLHYGPDDQLWVTERESGKVVRIDPTTGAKDQLIVIPDVYSSSRQDGLLGMALHEGFLEDNPYVYLSYTYNVDEQRIQKLVRYTFEVNEFNNGSLTEAMTILDNLPASNDHNSGRLVFGPDGKLYYTIGDQGGNQNSNYCNPILSQVLPSQEEVDSLDWSHYPGKILRLNTDGSIPEDNPVLNGVQSHIFSYGHRNPQGIVFGSNGSLYSDEHGPNTDDEVNRIVSGNNYGWPNVVGFKDDQAYDYCDWSSSDNCDDLNYQNGACPEGLTFLEESDFTDENYMEPLFSMFSVSDDYDYNNPECENAWICRPNVAPSSIAIYENDAIPTWKNSLLVTSLKRGRVFRLQLDESGTAVVGDTTHHFYTRNRYRDIAVHPDGKTFYMITDQEGNTSDLSGFNIERTMKNPGTILKFTLQESVSVVEKEIGGIRVWPNPVYNELHIQIDKVGLDPFRAEVIDAAGIRVSMFIGLKSGMNTRTIQGLVPGIYFLRVSSQDGIWTNKIILL